ncbi:sensor histidine kinase [Segnochrobactraceae bacterium EtOH-i3]
MKPTGRFWPFPAIRRSGSEAGDGARQPRRRLGLWLALLLLLANIPITLLAVATGLDARADRAEAARRVVERNAVLVATRQAHAIARVRGLAQAIARFPGVTTDPALCADAARALLAPESRLSRVVVRVEGRPVCTVDRPQDPEREAASPAVPAADLTLSIALPDEVTVQMDLQPGARVGTGGITRLTLDPGLTAVVLSPDGVIHDISGRPLAVSGPDLARVLSGLVGPDRFEATLGDGTGVFGVAEPVRDTDLVAVVLEPLDKLEAAANRDLMIAIALPLLALVVALVVSWIGMNRLVVRWIRRINRVARLYGAGRLSVRVGAIGTAPSEVRALASGFDTMADRVEKRSVDLQAALDSRTALLRELHHRVKNNFQLVASLVSLQARRADPPVRQALGALEVRVHVIAAAHRAAYAAGEIAAVPFGPLVRDVVEILRDGARLPVRQIALDQGPGLGAVDLDTAVAIAILVAEVLHPVLEAAALSGATVGIALAARDGAVVLTVTGPAAGRATREAGDGLSARLVAIYRRQLDASFQSAPDGQGVEIRLPGREFVVPPGGDEPPAHPDGPSAALG